MGAREDAARRWFGYGRWDAPYWFVGMEPGGSDDHASYESWEDLGGGALIDCRDHHEDSNRRAGRTITKWHRPNPRPPVQTTWGALIKVALSYEGRAIELPDIAAYQRDEWGRTDGDTAVLEISALHAAHTGVDVERTLHRTARLSELKKRLTSHKPAFALFYGTTYRGEYEVIAGSFGPDDWRWTGSTLCVLTQHPAARSPILPTYWTELGAWIRGLVDSGSGNEPEKVIPRPSGQRRVAAAPSKSASAKSVARQAVLGISLEFDPGNPKHTLELIEQLVDHHAFEQRHFERLHHFNRQPMSAHIKYCREKNRFNADTNKTVARRLHRLLDYVNGGEALDMAVTRVIRELPF